MNKPTSFPPSSVRTLNCQCASHVALESTPVSDDASPAPTPATKSTSRAKTSHEKIVPPPLAMRYSHF